MKTKEVLISDINSKIAGLEDKKRMHGDLHFVGQIELAISNLYRALATLYTN